jgi:hypothetical protein
VLYYTKKLFLTPIFYLFLLLQLNICIANECASLRIDLPTSPTSKIPVYDQDSLGICYSYAAAELVDFYRFSHGDTDNTITSPIVAALKSGSADWFRKDIDGGDIEKVILSIKKNGICDHRFIRDHWDSYSTKPFLDQMLNYFEMHKQYVKKVNSNLSIKSQILSLFGSKSTVKSPYHPCNDLINLGFPKDLIPSAEILDKLLSQNDPLVFLSGILERACHKYSKKIFIPEPTVASGSLPFGSNDKSSSDSIIAMINDQLDKKPAQATAIGYCGKMLHHKDYIGINRRTSHGLDWSGQVHRKGSIENVKDDCGPHASVVIGRRMSHGRCEFLIRNSWGSGCEGYPWDCEKGNIWVDSEKLAANTIKLTWIGK